MLPGGKKRGKSTANNNEKRNTQMINRKGSYGERRVQEIGRVGEKSKEQERPGKKGTCAEGTKGGGATQKRCREGFGATRSRSEEKRKGKNQAQPRPKSRGAEIAFPPKRS